MKRGKVKVLVLLAALAALSVGPPLAAQERPRRAADRPARARATEQRFGLGQLLARTEAEVRVRPTEEGVNVFLTSEDPEVVEGLHTRTAPRVERIPQVARRMRQEGRRPAEPLLMRMMMSGEVEVTTRSREDGLVVSFMAEDPVHREALRERLPAMLGVERPRREAPERRRLLREREDVPALRRQRPEEARPERRDVLDPRREVTRRRQLEARERDREPLARRRPVRRLWPERNARRGAWRAPHPRVLPRRHLEWRVRPRRIQPRHPALRPYPRRRPLVPSRRGRWFHGDEFLRRREPFRRWDVDEPWWDPEPRERRDRDRARRRRR